MGEMMRMAFGEVVGVVEGVLMREGMGRERAGVCARLFAEASRDGVPSHGLNRVGLMVKWMRAGTVVAHAEVRKVAGMGALERWDGGFGPGPWNAWVCMGRAIDLAREYGIGCVGLRNTNHWMRAGNYGWQAAEAGMLGMCWTNGIALMPAWGKDGAVGGRRIGNNPLVIAVPREHGEHVVLDMAMSQYSMGKLGILQGEGRETGLVAGFDASGRETREPGAVVAGGMPMPIGAWKGAGLGMVLDMVAAVVAGGRATREVKAEENEKGISQVFVAIDGNGLGGGMGRIVEGVVADVKGAGEGAMYPGERSMAARRESARLGVAVERGVWEGIVALGA